VERESVNVIRVPCVLFYKLKVDSRVNKGGGVKDQEEMRRMKRRRGGGMNNLGLTCAWLDLCNRRSNKTIRKGRIFFPG
jgi:hypothetical protein